jgi:hypothetical protein
MNAQGLIADARTAGFSIEVDGADLVIEADRDPPPELLAELRRHKAELIAFLTPPVAPAVDAGDLDERAAIIEYGAGVPRAWAEGFAALSTMPAPTGFLPERWQRFVDDAGKFLAGPFAAQAAALGWTALDLFGCDRDKPFARIDQAGLLWLLNGDKLIAMTENTAVIETPTGARQTYRRKPSDPGRVLAWELTP